MSESRLPATSLTKHRAYVDHVDLLSSESTSSSPPTGYLKSLTRSLSFDFACIAEVIAGPMFPTLPSLAALASKPFKRSQTGLFHGAHIQFGNNVPFSKHKTRRTWLPNIQNKGLYSDLLGREMNVKVTARALRTIKKVRVEFFALSDSVVEC